MNLKLEVSNEPVHCNARYICASLVLKYGTFNLTINEQAFVGRRVLGKYAPCFHFKILYGHEVRNVSIKWFLTRIRPNTARDYQRLWGAVRALLHMVVISKFPMTWHVNSPLRSAGLWKETHRNAPKGSTNTGVRTVWMKNQQTSYSGKIRSIADLAMKRSRMSAIRRPRQKRWRDLSKDHIRHS